MLPRISHLAQISNTGNAKNTRQNALANGPVSANLTKTGDTPIAIAPIVNAAKAMGRVRATEEVVGLFIIKPE